MDFYTTVRTEHLNHYGYLFGGEMLKWVDEFAYITAWQEFPKHRFVTRAMDAASFTRSVRLGALLHFHTERLRLGNTSVTYAITVTAKYLQQTEVEQVFAINVTMNAIDADGKKTQLPQD